MFENIPKHIYRKIGTGNACAWQNRAIVLLLASTKELLRAADENDGAFSPIGSVCVGNIYSSSFNTLTNTSFYNKLPELLPTLKKWIFNRVPCDRNRKRLRLTEQGKRRVAGIFERSTQQGRSECWRFEANWFCLDKISSLSILNTIKITKQTAWIHLFKSKIRIEYLVIGTGKACAWQKRAKVVLLGYLNDPLSCADGNVGPFNPMGSENFVGEWISKSFLRAVLWPNVGIRC